ncbi:MAG TPA: efflux transporter outer membrane subunit [Steroidobacteraceae bacterium]|nr:efflux transporter outer membrane subunit [Steroidobacteraceae bacterium]
MTSADLPATRANWIAKVMTLLKTLGPYALVEFVLPGGTLLALALWLYRHRRHATFRPLGPRALRWPLAFATGAAAAMIAGCTVGPDFVKPDAPVAAYSHSVPAAGGARDFVYGGEVAGDWYRLFRSDALDHLVRQALSNSPDLDAARHGLAAAQDELKAVSGAALPQINATGQIARGHINGSQLYEPVNAFKATGNDYDIGPSLAYDLDPFGGIRRSIESQRAQTAAVQDQLRDTYVTLVDQVVITAFDYAAVREQIRVTRSLVSELQAQYTLNVQLENAGKIIHSDTLQAETQLENVRATLPGLEQQRDTYRDALARLTGQTPDRFRMPALTLADFTLPGQLPVSLPSALVQQRPDVLAAQESLHAASAQIGVAEAARLPQLTLSAQYAQDSSTLNDLFTQPGGVWSAGLGLAAPLFHGGTLKARAEEARQRYAQSVATYRSTVIGAFVDVADALQALQHDADSYTAHNRALEAAGASRDLAIQEYRAGKYTELQVLTAEQQYQDAALTQVQADAQRFTDTAALFRALGGGWWNASDRTPLGAADSSSPIATSRISSGSSSHD